MSKYAGFSSVQLTKPRRSEFDLSAFKRSTTRMGRLTPVFVTECIPGDTFRGNSEILLRLAPLLAPIYDSIQLFVHFWFVPNRLLWEDWEEFITGGREPGVDPVDPPIPPYVDLDELFTTAGAMCEKSQLLDYLGVPPNMFLIASPGDYAGKHLDAMPALAYQLIYMENYRDRNFLGDDALGYEFPLPSGDLSDIPSLNLTQVFTTRTRNYMHDYFTSALPFTQRGEEVMMPVSVSGDLPLYGSPLSSPSATIRLKGEEQPGPVDTQYGIGEDNTLPAGTLIARLDNASSSTSINDFRSAMALQVWYERNAVGGSRYVESTQAHFGVRPQDSRLQRPEFIGGGIIKVRIQEIVSTAYSNDGVDTVPLANMAGHGITYGNTNQFNYFCAEHGFIMGIASIMNPPSYHTGLPRMFRRRSFLDYPWPTFAKLGEQQVDKAEIFASPSNLTEDSNGLLPLWGYQSRYADWKILHNTNHGDFHDTLLFWTLTRDFGEPGPELGLQFNEFDGTTQDRIFAVNGNQDNFWMYINNNVTVRRCLPYFSAPNNLGFQ